METSLILFFQKCPLRGAGGEANERNGLMHDRHRGGHEDDVEEIKEGNVDKDDWSNKDLKGAG